MAFAFANPPDGSRGSRSAPGSRRLSHIRQITVFSLPCLGVYHWSRTQVTLTPATFRLPHPRPSARLGSEAEARMALHAFILKRSEVGGGAKVRARGFGVFAEGSPRRSLRTPPTSGAAKRTGDSACFVSHQLWYNIPLTHRTGRWRKVSEHGGCIEDKEVQGRGGLYA